MQVEEVGRINDLTTNSHPSSSNSTSNANPYSIPSSSIPYILPIESTSNLTSHPLTPRRITADTERLQLLNSLEALTWILLFLSYLLSPLHLFTLILRVLSHVQFTAPRKLTPDRSIKGLLLLWSLVNSSSMIIHFIDGSSGTKGSNAWNSKGLVIDFIGQSVTPSKFHLILNDMVIALVQFVIIVLSFADPTLSTVSTMSVSTSTTSSGVASTTTSSVDSSNSRRIRRDLTGLLGDQWADRVVGLYTTSDGRIEEEEEEAVFVDDEREEDSEARATRFDLQKRRNRRRRIRNNQITRLKIESTTTNSGRSTQSFLSHHSNLHHHHQSGGTPSQHSTSTIDAPVFEINFRNIWIELRRRKNSKEEDEEDDEETILLDLEEGR